MIEAMGSDSDSMIRPRSGRGMATLAQERGRGSEERIVAEHGVDRAVDERGLDVHAVGAHAGEERAVAVRVFEGHA
ncbi:hypothetical protein ABU614_09920 [Lysobacter firmicutimachus]|uniref:Uncharacterized protein n=1 Tax=Lysobacter firmicutimachus TaxID=1792846 RepID=A0AAU8MXT0_9GAMM